MKFYKLTAGPNFTPEYYHTEKEAVNDAKMLEQAYSNKNVFPQVTEVQIGKINREKVLYLLGGRERNYAEKIKVVWATSDKKRIAAEIKRNDKIRKELVKLL